MSTVSKLLLSIVSSINLPNILIKNEVESKKEKYIFFIEGKSKYEFTTNNFLSHRFLNTTIDI